MRWNNDLIPPRALTFLLPVVLIGAGRPAELFASVTQGGFPALLGGLLLGLGGMALDITLISRYRNLRLVDITRAVFGQVGGTLVTLGYALWWMAGTSKYVRAAAETITLTLLPNTPEIVTIGSLVFVASYLMRHGFEPVARLSFIIFPIVFVVTMLFYAIVILQTDITRVIDAWMVPLAEAGKGSLLVAARYDSFAFLLAVAGFLRDGGLWWPGLRGFLFVAVFYAFSYTTVVSVFSFRGVGLYRWPLNTAIQNLTLPGFLIERLDIIYIFLFIVLTVLSVAASLSVTLAIARMLLGNRYPIILVAGIWLGVTTLAQIPPSGDWVIRADFRVLVYISGFFAYFLPLTMLLVSYLREGFKRPEPDGPVFAEGRGWAR